MMPTSLWSMKKGREEIRKEERKKEREGGRQEGRMKENWVCGH